jgi:hypothetical protein
VIRGFGRTIHNWRNDGGHFVVGSYVGPSGRATGGVFLSPLSRPLLRLWLLVPCPPIPLTLPLPETINAFVQTTAKVMTPVVLLFTVLFALRAPRPGEDEEGCELRLRLHRIHLHIKGIGVGPKPVVDGLSLGVCSTNPANSSAV